MHRSLIFGATTQAIPTVIRQATAAAMPIRIRQCLCHHVVGCTTKAAIGAIETGAEVFKITGGLEVSINGGIDGDTVSKGAVGSAVLDGCVAERVGVIVLSVGTVVSGVCVALTGFGVGITKGASIGATVIGVVVVGSRVGAKVGGRLCAMDGDEVKRTGGCQVHYNSIKMYQSIQ